MALIGDFLRALGQIPDRGFLWVFLKALGLTVLLLIALTLGFGWLVSFLPTDLGEWWLIGQVTIPVEALQGLAVGAVLFASTFLMIPVAAVFVGFFLDEIADAVERRHYPGRTGTARGNLVSDLMDAVRFMGVVIGVNLLALIPYLILLVVFAPLTAALAFAINGYLLGREYFELVAVRHMPSAEARALRKRYSGRIWFAGVLMAIPLTIPVMNLIVPVLGVATITHQFHRLWRA